MQFSILGLLLILLGLLLLFVGGVGGVLMGTFACDAPTAKPRTCLLIGLAFAALPWIGAIFCLIKGVKLFL